MFSRFEITLDYPMRKPQLRLLPPRPTDAGPARPTLQTTGDDDEDVAGKGDVSTNSTKPTAKGPQDRYVAPEMKDWTPIYRVGHQLMILTMLNNGPHKLFILDTGAFSTTISPEVAREVTKVHSNDNIKVRGLSGQVSSVYTAESITFRFANVSQNVRDVVAFDSPSISKSTGLEIAGFIGYTALAQMTIGIDYRDGLMKFSYDPNRGFHPQ
ncbi:MAG TPA: retropepsin-like aspartic protease [Edaphobacter sp.]|nr:retropepsin-like aspartic protease [Edaphobacter sp.]